METNISAEAGADDPVIEVPWTDPSNRLQYVEPRSGAAWVDEIVEARDWPEIRQALLAIHSGTLVFTVKCDAWILSESEKQLDFGPVDHGFGAYFDIVCRRMHATQNDLLTQVEAWAQALRSDTLEARCDFVIRPAQIRGAAGYAVTAYVFGYGDTEHHARQNWASALKRLTALLTED